MAKAVVQIARLVIIRMLEIHRAKIVRWAFIQIKVFNILLLLVKNVLRVRIPPPKACPVLAGATIVPRANIPRKKEIPRKTNATIVQPIHSAPNLDETNRVTRVKKERHQKKVQPFVLAVMLVPI